MKFTRFLAPDSLELLNFRVTVRASGCRHCRSVEQSPDIMIAQATKYDVSVEIPGKSPGINLEITFDDNLEINKYWRYSFILLDSVVWSDSRHLK